MKTFKQALGDAHLTVHEFIGLTGKPKGTVMHWYYEEFPACPIAIAYLTLWRATQPETQKELLAAFNRR